MFNFFEEPAKMFSNVTASFYFPTSNARGFQGPCYFFSTFKYISVIKKKNFFLQNVF